MRNAKNEEDKLRFALAPEMVTKRLGERLQFGWLAALQ